MTTTYSVLRVSQKLEGGQRLGGAVDWCRYSKKSHQRSIQKLINRHESLKAALQGKLDMSPETDRQHYYRQIYYCLKELY